MKSKLLLFILFAFSFTNAQNVISNLSAQATTSTTANVSFSIQNNCVNGFYTVQLSLSSGFSSPFYSATTAITDCSATPVQKTVAITGLTASTTYYYRIIAGPNNNPTANPDYSATASFSTNILIPTLTHQTNTSTTSNVIFTIQNNCTSVEYQVQYSTASNFANPLYSALNTMTDCSPTAIQKTAILSGLTLGTTYYYRVMARYGTAGAWVYSVSSNLVAGSINISQISHQNVTSSTADISYTVQNNCQLVYYKVEYSKFSNFSQLISSAQLSTSNCVGNSFSETTFLTNLIGATTYYYRLSVSYNATGPWTLSTVNNFTTLADPTGLIHEWKFNTTYMNESNSIAFTPNSSGTAFSGGRDGLTNGAVFTSQFGGGQATISNIPLNTQARTVSLWVNVSAYLTGNGSLFFYGSSVTNQGFGLGFNRTGNNVSVLVRGINNDVTYPISATTGTWQHLVASYDGTTVRLYINGTLVAAVPKSWSTVGNTASFGGNFDGRIDDLKIYDRAITDTEAANLYYYNSVVVPAPTSPSIASITTTTLTNSATINYSLNANNASTTSIVRYGLSSTTLSNQVTGFVANFNAPTNGSASITGLTSNTQYFYQIEATNTAGTTQSTMGTFTTTDDSPVAYYLFNNTYTNINNQSPFSSTNATFVNDRNNQANAAIRVGSTTTPITATVPNIPIGNSIRSVSMWYKKPTHTAAIGLFAYGANASQQTFGVYLSAGGGYVFQTFGSDYSFGGSSAANTWIHLVITYNGASAKLYADGTLIGQSFNFTLNTQNAAFRLGGNTAIVEFDDLRIFNYELTQSQVSSLYNNNSLSSTNFSQNNLEVSLYPNPVNDVLNIETTLEVKSVEIYNIQGQKVLSSNQKQINVSDLSAGMYMIRIQDSENNSATKKIVIN
jgi:Concanavalin A-like lectin/glucanases superfamily/Secretion system C-terminal sorting domain